MFSLSASVGSCGTFLDSSLPTFALALLRWSKVYPQAPDASVPNPAPYRRLSPNAPIQKWPFVIQCNPWGLEVSKPETYPCPQWMQEHTAASSPVQRPGSEPSYPRRGAVDSKWMLPDHVASQKAESAWTAMLSKCSCPGGPFKTSTFNCGNSIETMQNPNWMQSPYTGTNERKMKQSGTRLVEHVDSWWIADLSTSPSPMLKAGVVPFPMVKFRVSVMVFQSVCNWIQ